MELHLAEHWLERDYSSMGSPHEGSIRRPIAPWANTLTTELHLAEHWLERDYSSMGHTMKDRSDDPSHHERTLLPWSYISWSTGWNEIIAQWVTPWRIDPTTHRTMSERSYHRATSRSYNNSIGPPWRTDPTTHRTMSEHSYHGATSRSYNSSMGPLWRINPTTHRTMSERSYHGATSRSYNSSMGPPWRIDPTTHRTMSERSYHGATSRGALAGTRL